MNFYETFRIKLAKKIVSFFVKEVGEWILLSEYYQDEEGDMYRLEQQLALVEMVGKQNWLVQQL